MNCKFYQSEIDRMIGEAQLSQDILSHLDDCAACQNFRHGRDRLRHLILNLSVAAAPADFNFRVKAKLKNKEAAAIGAWLQWHKLTLVAASFAVLLVGFVLINRFSKIPPPVAPPTVAIVALPAPSIVAAQIPEPQTTLPVAQASSENDKNSITPRVLPESKAKSLVKPDAAGQRETTFAAMRVNKNVGEKKPEIHSRDSAAPINSSIRSVSAAEPPVMSKGIPDPLAAPRPQNGKDLLETFGVQTITTDNNSLRVVSVKPESQSAKAGLEINDLIEKINSETPTAVSGNTFAEIKLVVRRNNQTRAITITTKP